MAIEIKSDRPYQATNLDIPSRPPLPDGALGMVDYQAGGSITQTDIQFGANNALVFSGVGSFRPRYYYGQSGLTFGTGAARVSYDAEGLPQGIRVRGVQDQRLPTSMRANLSLGTPVGATCVDDGTEVEQFRKWYLVTPTGAGEASITLTGGTLSANGFVWISFEVSGSGFVQIGGKNIDPDDYVNFDLSTGQFLSGGGALAQAIRRKNGAWSLQIRTDTSASVTEIGPYIASVLSLNAAKLGPAGAAFRARCQTVVAGSSQTIGRTPAEPWASPDAQATDTVSPVIITDTDDFSAVLTMTSDTWPYRVGSGMFTFVSGSAGIHVVQTAGGNIAIVKSTGEVLHSFETLWQPNTRYSIGITRVGTTFTVVINDEIARITDAMVAYAPRFYRGLDTAVNEWGGYALKAYFWTPRSDNELLGLVERWG